MQIEILSRDAARLGEGPVWDATQECLYWVDSLGPTLYRSDADGRSVEHWSLPGKSVGSLAPRASGGLILALDQGLYAFAPDSNELDLIASPLAADAGMRFNDGKVDPYGQFVCGAMNLDESGGLACPMFRLDAALEVTRILDGFFCFNGPCFNAAGDTLYLTGRQAGIIEAFDYAADTCPSNPRQLIATHEPDGATVDAEDCLWSAQWDGECLLRITPDGEIDYRLSIPGQIISSVMFGGPSLDRIYVTTLGVAAWGATPSADGAGCVLMIRDSGFRGRAEPRFAG